MGGKFSAPGVCLQYGMRESLGVMLQRIFREQGSTGGPHRLRVDPAMFLGRQPVGVAILPLQPRTDQKQGTVMKSIHFTEVEMGDVLDMMFLIPLDPILILPPDADFDMQIGVDVERHLARWTPAERFPTGPQCLQKEHT